MSLIRCTECGREISNNADKCPYCGNPVKKGLGCFSTFGIIILIIIGVLYILGSIFKDSSNVKTDYCYGQEMLAYRYAEGFVKQDLKALLTAKFPSLTERSQHVRNSYDCSYKINSWVDSQNSFGATIRTNFSCTIVFEGGYAKCKDLKFE